MPAIGSGWGTLPAGAPVGWRVPHLPQKMSASPTRFPQWGQNGISINCYDTPASPVPASAGGLLAIGGNQRRNRRIRAQRRAALVPLRRLLVGAGQSQDAAFGKPRSGDHQADGQARRGKSARNRNRGNAVDVKGGGVIQR